MAVQSFMLLGSRVCFLSCYVPCDKWVTVGVDSSLGLPVLGEGTSSDREVELIAVGGARRCRTCFVTGLAEHDKHVNLRTVTGPCCQCEIIR